MNEQRFDRGATGNSAAASVNMKARFDLTNAIRERVESWKVTQATAAKQLGISQPRINDLLRGRIDMFSLDALMKSRTAGGSSGRASRGAVDGCVPRSGSTDISGQQDRPAVAQGSPPETAANSVSESEAEDRKKIEGDRHAQPEIEQFQPQVGAQKIETRFGTGNGAQPA